jgi:dTDP-4-dehydrorhamnose 3,5-epimerase
MPEFEEPLPGVLVRRLKRFTDDRGWLIELFRDDELPNGFLPAMGYISITHPGVARGPHEHVDQTDGFVFLSGTFRLFLWESRSEHEARDLTLDVGEREPIFVTVPPGVVHAYKNIGDTDAFVLNFPDRLYAGKGKAEPVDEIRHEDDDDTRYRMDD